MKYYVIDTDNFKRCIATEPAYQALRLEMSSGDFGVHRAAIVTKRAAMIISTVCLDFDGVEFFEHTIK